MYWKPGKAQLSSSFLVSCGVTAAVLKYLRKIRTRQQISKSTIGQKEKSYLFSSLILKISKVFKSYK